MYLPIESDSGDGSFHGLPARSLERGENLLSAEIDQLTDQETQDGQRGTNELSNSDLKQQTECFKKKQKAHSSLNMSSYNNATKIVVHTSSNSDADDSSDLTHSAR